MFRPMRRKLQVLSVEETVDILNRNTAGTLALSGDDGYPYSVPMSYAYQDGKIFFHCAKTGHKMDAVKACDKASFCVIDRDEVMPEKYTTLFQSVIAFGRIRVVDDPDERLAALKLLGEKYSTNSEEELKRHIDGRLSAVAVLELDIEHMSGKEGFELVRMRQA
ncbi:MAG TPA: pyridoxamine 5'-phosphate oxidase family protein [Eubacteriales bacterium]|nr:pyridoxamine 5'-phosphate oxidase family protein [Clostridia bacterium]HRV72710.1 pyridoxamine 5'-phosphate oxidase family protein [Eubacteriales bacterium]